jgi:hypothetical protein
VEAEEADDVCAIGVEVLALAGAVQADFGSGSFDALVADVTEQRAVGVLADRCTEVETEAK